MTNPTGLPNPLPYAPNCLDHGHFEAEWERCWPWLQRSLDVAPGRFAERHVYAKVMAGQAHFWRGDRCAVVTEFQTYPTGLRTLSYWLAGGPDNQAWSEIIHLNDTWIEPWAQRAGCREIEIWGRRGWCKKYPRFRDLGAYLTMEIE